MRDGYGETADGADDKAGENENEGCGYPGKIHAGGVDGGKGKIVPGVLRRCINSG